MGLFRWISEQRERVILGPAYGHLSPNEEVSVWVRARQPGTRKEGFVYLTPLQVIVRWTGRGDGHYSVAWSDIEAWGINNELPRGPVLALQDGNLDVVAQLPILTHATAGEVRQFMSYFKRMAPAPRRELRLSRALREKGAWRSEVPTTIARSNRTTAEKTRRVVITLLGLILVVGGIIITPLPGPWSFPIVLGGLAVLSSEYDWAKDALQWARKQYQQAKKKVRQRRSAGT